MGPEILGAILVGLLALWLLTQPWFWIIALLLGGLVACFAMLASIVNFQILWAVGFFLLMAMCWGSLSFFSDYIQDRRMDGKKRRLKRRLSEYP